MSDLTPRERALVSPGAAMGSNCVSCIGHHVPASRSAGLSDAEIAAAIVVTCFAKSPLDIRGRASRT